MHFLYTIIRAPPEHKNLWPMGHKISQLGRSICSHNNEVLVVHLLSIQERRRKFSKNQCIHLEPALTQEPLTQGASNFKIFEETFFRIITMYFICLIFTSKEKDLQWITEFIQSPSLSPDLLIQGPWTSQS